MGKDKTRLIGTIITTLILLTLIFSGCIQKENNSVDTPEKKYDKIYPYAEIETPDTIYFNKNITIKAKNPYDDGDIISYKWYFLNEKQPKEGQKISHIFVNKYDKIENYPIIQPVFLFLTDNDNNLKVINQNVEIYPDKYSFYLGKNQLTLNKTKQTYDLIKPRLDIIKSTERIKYEFDKPIKLYQNRWQASIYINKPLFGYLKSLKIGFFNAENEVLDEQEYILKNNFFWRSKKIVISGTIKESIIDYVEISFKGLTLFNNIAILYDAEHCSNIVFNFTKPST